MRTIKSSFITIAFIFMLILPNTGFGQSQNAYLTGEILVGFRMEMQLENLPSDLDSLNLQYLSSSRVPRLLSFKYPNSADINELIRQLEQLPYVEYAEPNYIFFNTEAYNPNDEYYSDPPGAEEGQWYLRTSESYSIDASHAWDIARGSGQRIAILDNGHSSHVDVSDKIESQWDAVDHSYNPEEPYTTTVEEDGQGEYRLAFRATGDYSNTDSYPNYEHYHGLAVAGVAGAETNNQQEGIAAAAPDADLVMVRVKATYHLNRQRYDEINGWYDECCIGDYYTGLEYDDLTNAIMWAVDYGDADVINISVCFNIPCDEVGSPSAMQNAINYAVANNVVVVAAAGNSGGETGHEDQDPLQDPACRNNVLSIGASDISNNVPSWSESHPTQLDFVAPGVDIWVTTPASATASDTGLADEYHLNNIDSDWINDHGGYDKMSGTSLAAPIFAGGVAVLRSFIPDLGSSQIDTVFEETAENTNNPSRDGKGRINLYDAISSLFVPTPSLELIDSGPQKVLAPGGKSIEITWNAYNGYLSYAYYQVWKKVDGGSWSIIRPAVDPDEREVIDPDVYPEHTYYYYIEAVESIYGPVRGKSNVASLYYDEEGGGGGEPKNDEVTYIPPEKLTLNQNYPNPFNPDTQIRFGLPNQSHVRLTIMNIRGEIVRVLVDEEKPAGWHSITWDSKGANGRNVATGVYLYILEVEGKRILKKMTLIR